MNAPATVTFNPCLDCGACCASFRVSFYWAEAVSLGLPDTVLEQASPWHACLRGTNQPAPRCHALQGEVGQSVSCSLYAQRPSPCREVRAGDAQCRKARQRHGLPALAAAEAFRCESG